MSLWSVRAPPRQSAPMRAKAQPQGATALMASFRRRYAGLAREECFARKSPERNIIKRSAPEGAGSRNGVDQPRGGEAAGSWSMLKLSKGSARKADYGTVSPEACAANKQRPERRPLGCSTRMQAG